MPIRRRVLRRPALLLSLVALVGAVWVSGAVAGEAAARKPFVVKIHADWCGTCTRLVPTFEALEQKYGERANLVVLDVTDKQTLAEATVRAKELGISEFFDRYKGRTGTIGILLADGETVRVLAGETDLGRYDDVIELAIERSAS